MFQRRQTRPNAPIPSLIMRMTWTCPPAVMPKLETHVASHAVPSKPRSPRRTMRRCRGRERGLRLATSTWSRVGIWIGGRLRAAEWCVGSPSGSESSVEVSCRFSSWDCRVGG